MKNKDLMLQPLLAAVLMLCGTIAFAQQNTTYQYEYDANGNLTKITDPLNRVTNQAYDALNRLSVQQQPLINGVRPTITYTYDGLDQLFTVKDARNALTQYDTDGLGNLTTLNSPDTIATNRTYDDAGNVKTTTDAKQQTTSFQYDGLNRVTQISYADGTNVLYMYDVGPNAKGRLYSVVDPIGSTQYEYDQSGRITKETRNIGSVAYATSYIYDTAGRLSGVTYPSGRQIAYTRDFMGRILQIDTTKDNVAKTLVSQVTYHPFGGIKSFLNGAGQVVQKNIDLDGRINGYNLANNFYAVSYDAASRILSINDAINVANNQNFGYDELDRLTSYSGTGGSQSFGYDLNGNRLSKTIGTTNTTYAYGNSNNIMGSISGSQNASIIVDNNGSITDNGINQFSYDARGRMTSAQTALGTVTYKINAFGQRVAKTVQGATTVYHYDQTGKLIAESDDQGTVQKEYIYLNDSLVAVAQ